MKITDQLKRGLSALIRPFEDRFFRRLNLEAKQSPQLKIAQKELWLKYRESAQSGDVPPLSATGFRCFSQFEEDGILLYIFAIIGIYRGSFLDLGAGDGINSNCANLAVNFGWTGVFIDGDPRNVEKGRKYYQESLDCWAYPPSFFCRMITAENINDLLREARVTEELDLLSIDIDGNDYWVWNALDAVKPKVVVVETHVEFGLRNIVVPYDPDYVYPGRHPQYHGASPIAMARLARSKGYRLVGANAYGFNTIYVRNDLAEELLPEVSVESILAHPRNAERAKLFEPIKDWEYVEG